MTASLDRYKLTLDQYQQSRSHIFPTLMSLRWFMTRNRDALVRGPAFIVPVKQILLDPDAFDALVEQVGHLRAEA
jgi:hypothetical protein